jgi:peptide/nickel transport system permease protein
LIRRSIGSLGVLFGVLFVVFFLTRILPGDPALVFAGAAATEENLAVIRQHLGLDRPLYEQFFNYLAGFFTGDWGRSYATQRPVLTSILGVLPDTLVLVVISISLAIIVSITLGVLAAAHRGSPIDILARVLSSAGVGIPTFWMAMFLQFVFFYGLRVLPFAYYADPTLQLLTPVTPYTGSLLIDSLLSQKWTLAGDVAIHMILPVTALMIYGTGHILRQIRTAMMGVLEDNYIRTARAYGLPSRKILYTYALKNAIVPMIVVSGLVLGGTILSVFYIETVFGLSGVGGLAYHAIVAFDYPLIVGIATVMALVYIIINFSVDVIQFLLDKRTAI